MAQTTPRLVVVGVGLIGGSIALAARQRSVAAEVVGVVRSEASRRRALESGVVESVTTNLAEAVETADIVVACTPVADLAKTLLEAAKSCRSDALLTDAGSTKVAIVAAMQAGLASFAEPPDAESPDFVGSHPLAGDHRTGPESARADLLEGRTVVVTPAEQTSPQSTVRATEFWESLGATVTLMTPGDHDAALARTSHLPHLLAAALAGATPAEVLSLAASGWRDTTRVAAGSPALWRDILLANRDETIAALNDVDALLGDYRQALVDRDGDRIEQLLEQGRQRRDAVGD